MLDRSRRVLLAWTLACFAGFGVLALGVGQGWEWLAEIDDEGQGLRAWALDDAGLGGFLRVVEEVFRAQWVLLAMLGVALLVLSRGHRRAAVYAAGVALASAAGFRGLKVLVDRERPPWQLSTSLHETESFPSGHATMVTALAMVVVVLVVMLVRRAVVRRLAVTLSALVVLVVCLDRVLLGRHYPSDVVGGVLLSVGLGLLGLVVYSPLPRSHALKIDPLPEAIPSAKRLAVVLNPIKVEDVGAFQSIVDQMARGAGWSAPRWHLTTVEDSGTGQAERASIEGADLVIVCGGDGTVREVCAELAGTGIPVGIVPAGTGNLLARNLGIPLYIRAALDIALTGQDRAIDMVSVRGDRGEPEAEDHGEQAPGGGFESHFLVMAGMGFDAAIMEGVNEDLKKRVGWIAYVVSALKSLMSPVVKVEISIDGAEYTRHRARTVVVGNVGSLQAGMPLLPDASIDDGQLDVVLIYPRRFLSWIPVAFRVLAKRRRTDDTVNRMTGRTVSIRAHADTPRQLDGDSIGPGKELHMECIHGRLLVRVPR